MSSDHVHSPLLHAPRLSLGVAAVAGVLTVAFHFLLLQRGHGVAFVLFVLLLVIGLHVIAWLTNKPVNRWAHLFLVPVLFSAIAELLYASDVVILLGFAITFISLIFFSYWYVAPPVAWREVKTLWPRELLFEAVLPVESTRSFLEGFSFSRYGKRLLTGIALAVPLLLVIGVLFAQADPLFGKVFSNWFAISNDKTFLRVVHLVMDGFVLIFFIRAGWAMITRAIEQRRPQQTLSEEKTSDPVVLGTGLALLNALFIIFLGFQLVYFFGGVAWIQAQDITYASYARGGFFQLLAVAGIVFLIAFGLFYLTEMRERWSRRLTLALIVETAIVMVSAWHRLWLYIDAYGLTVSRFWAAVVVIFIALCFLLLVAMVMMKQTYSTLSKTLLMYTLMTFSILLLINVEGLVVRFNADRFLAGETGMVDIQYMRGLSTAAVPEEQRLLQANWPTASAKTAYPGTGGDSIAEQKSVLHRYLETKRDQVRIESTKDWRYATWSDYRAMILIDALK